MKNNISIAFNRFVYRQTPQSQFSHWDIPDAEIYDRIEENWDNKKAGYRSGVWLVPISPAGFYSGVVELKEGDKLSGEFSSRKKGETPRKHMWVKGKKLPAVAVDVVLYSHNVLAENNEFDTDAHYEIISINARNTVEEQPIEPMTLLYNHFNADGGTATNMTNDKLVEALRESFEYWKNKVLVKNVQKDKV